MAKAKQQVGTLLSGEDFFTGGEDPYTPVTIPSIKKSGKPGLVYIRRLTVEEALSFKGDESDDKGEKMLSLVAKVVVNPDGTPLWTLEQAKKLSTMDITSFSTITEAITKMARPDGDEGNASSEASGSASSTN